MENKLARRIRLSLCSSGTPAKLTENSFVGQLISARLARNNNNSDDDRKKRNEIDMKKITPNSNHSARQMLS